jgi:putative membrane protein
MEEISNNKPAGKARNPRDHMANERTFLAWIRTGIGIMAFGFVVEKFAFFIKHLSAFLGKPIASEPGTSSIGYSSIFGIVLVALGALMGVLAFIKYKKVEREIEEDTYRPSVLLDIMITLLVIGMGAFFVFYMIFNL